MVIMLKAGKKKMKGEPYDELKFQRVYRIGIGDHRGISREVLVFPDTCWKGNSVRQEEAWAYSSA